MSQDDTYVLPTEQNRVLVTQMAEAVLEQVAPEELVLFDDTEAEYFKDPDKALQAGSRDEPVGFGLEMALLTPYVLAVAGPVVKFLVSLVADSANEGSKTLVAEWMRRVFKSKDEPPTAAAASDAKARSRQWVPCAVLRQTRARPARCGRSRRSARCANPRETSARGW